MKNVFRTDLGPHSTHHILGEGEKEGGINRSTNPQIYLHPLMYIQHCLYPSKYAILTSKTALLGAVKSQIDRASHGAV